MILFLLLDTLPILEVALSSLSSFIFTEINNIICSGKVREFSAEGSVLLQAELKVIQFVLSSPKVSCFVLFFSFEIVCF